MKVTTITVILEHEGMIDRDVAVKHLLSHIDEIEQSNYKRIDDMIEFSLKNKIIVQVVKEQYRGLGKTTKLAQKAKELGAVLLVKDKRSVQYLVDMGFYNSIYFNGSSLASGTRLSKGFLVDEGVHPDIIRALSQNNELLGGFSRIY